MVTTFLVFISLLPILSEDLILELKSDASLSFSGWVLLLDDREVCSFDDKGQAKLTEKPEGLIFEIRDSENQARHVGSWSDIAVVGNQVIFISPNDGLYQKLVVSASRIKQEVFRVAAEVSVISPEENEERSVSQTSDWLKEQAEVSLQKTNLGGGSPIMRGMSGNRILLMVDGFRVNNSIFRLGLNQYLNTVPGSQLEQIEVLSGPSGVQYGSDGLGGTIHLRAADPASQDPELSYRGFVSSADGTHNHNIAGNTRYGDLSFSGHFKFYDYADLEAADPIGEQDPTGYDGWDGSFNVSLDIADEQRLRFINSQSSARHVPRTDRILSGRDLLWEYHPQDFRLHGLRYESKKAGQIADFMDLGVAFMEQGEGNRRISTGSPDLLQVTDTQVGTLQFNGTFTKIVGPFQWVYGFDFQRDNVDASGFDQTVSTGEVSLADGKFPNDASYESWGAFLNMSRDFGDHWRLQTGVRQTGVQLKGTLVEPIGFVDESYDQTTGSFSFGRGDAHSYFGFSASQGFRAPNLEDALSLGPSNQGFDAPNPGLGPEKVWNYELNMRLRRQAHFFQSSIYTARYTDLMEKVSGSWLGQDTIDGEPVFILDNVGRATVDGISMTYQWTGKKGHRLALDGSYVYGQQTDLDVPMRRISPLRGNLSHTWEHSRLKLTSTFSWADRQDRLSPGDLDDSRIPEGGTPGYGVFHMRGRWQHSENLGFNLGLENLGDKLYKVHGSGIYEPGRRAVLELEARWK